MDFETRELVEKILELTEENNRILRKMRRSMFWGRVMSIIYWVLIIGISLGLYYYLQPVIDRSFEFFNTTKDSLGSIDRLTEILNSVPR